MNDRVRNQVGAPEGHVGGREAAAHPQAARPHAPGARCVRVWGPPGFDETRGVFVKMPSAAGGVPALGPRPP